MASSSSLGEDREKTKKQKKPKMPITTIFDSPSNIKESELNSLISDYHIPVSRHMVVAGPNDRVTSIFRKNRIVYRFFSVLSFSIAYHMILCSCVGVFTIAHFPYASVGIS